MVLELVVDEELSLRLFQEEDAHVIFDLIDRNREHLSMHYDDTSKKYPTQDAVLESILNPKDPNRLRFGIWDGDIFVGTINLASDGCGQAEIGYYLGSEFTGKGYMTRAVKRLAQYAFEEMDLKSLFADTYIDNRASQAVLERSGFMLAEKATLTLRYALKK